MNRDNGFKQLEDSSIIWDIIIIGGGSTGLGAALDSASRGYKTLLLEQSDFGKGTSSRSTKLIHGGVRYLKQMNFSLVFEALHERGIMIKNAPHIGKSQSFIIPAYKWLDLPFYGCGLKFYDFMAGKLSLGKSRMLSKKETIRRIETVSTDSLVGGIEYMDGQFDDSRFTTCLAQTAEDHGATVLNYTKVKGLIKNNDQVQGVIAEDLESGTQYEIKAKAVINATGIFTDDIRKLDDKNSSKIISVSQGSHIVVDKSFLPGNSAIMIPKTADGRVLFAVPWLDHVIIGTTDIPVKEPKLEPKARDEEIEFILSHAKKYLNCNIDISDVLSAYSGLRPLVDLSGEEGATSKLSREHTIFTSKTGLITITGGKWTTYRKMAEDVVNTAIKVAKLPDSKCLTKNIILHGGENFNSSENHLSRYGSDSKKIKALMEDDNSLSEKFSSHFPNTKAEVIFSIRNEMARSSDDILARRTRSLLLNAKAAVQSAPTISQMIAKELGFSEDWVQADIDKFKNIAKNYILA